MSLQKAGGNNPVKASENEGIARNVTNGTELSVTRWYFAHSKSIFDSARPHSRIPRPGYAHFGASQGVRRSRRLATDTAVLLDASNRGDLSCRCWRDTPPTFRFFICQHPAAHNQVATHHHGRVAVHQPRRGHVPGGAPDAAHQTGFPGQGDPRRARLDGGGQRRERPRTASVPARQARRHRNHPPGTGPSGGAGVRQHPRATDGPATGEPGQDGGDGYVHQGQARSPRPRHQELRDGGKRAHHVPPVQRHEPLGVHRPRPSVPKMRRKVRLVGVAGQAGVFVLLPGLLLLPAAVCLVHLPYYSCVIL